MLVLVVRLLDNYLIRFLLAQACLDIIIMRPRNCLTRVFLLLFALKHLLWLWWKLRLCLLHHWAFLNRSCQLWGSFCWCQSRCLEVCLVAALAGWRVRVSFGLDIRRNRFHDFIALLRWNFCSYHSILRWCTKCTCFDLVVIHHQFFTGLCTHQSLVQVFLCDIGWQRGDPKKTWGLDWPTSPQVSVLACRNADASTDGLFQPWASCSVNKAILLLLR